jgi:predicted permease
MPGIRAASLFSNGYLSGNSWTDKVSAEGVADPDQNLECAITRVGPRFFETFGTPLLSGREFSRQDERPLNSANVIVPGTAVINQTMARLYFGDASPLGKRFYLTHQPEQKFEVVGVVPDAKYRSLRDPPPPMFYIPLFQEPRSSWANFALRTTADPRSTMADLPSVVRAVDPSVRVRDLRTMSDMMNRSVQQERLIAQLGGFFSVFALALACLGVYGVLSFAVVQRTREIGVRMALGAQRRDVVSLVVNQGLKLVLVGSVIGLGAALAATRLVSSLLYGVTPTDPVTFAGVSILLVLVAVLASWLPAKRATKVDPMEALRYE